MRKFRFRLQKILEYREAMEHWAQEAYLETRVARLEGEAALQDIRSRRSALLQNSADSLAERRELEMAVQVLDDDETAQKTVIEVLVAEESKAFDVWQEKRRELETMVKLRDHALDAWTLEETRYEQAQLDEWAVLKRSA
ncbi:MAG TPA: flagellar FliJ family protein [Fimbriimonadaceae bacterium]|nr:flagellar FliJ family protein [Fimbriimonadaceae bacterium]